MVLFAVSLEFVLRDIPYYGEQRGPLYLGAVLVEMNHEILYESLSFFVLVEFHRIIGGIEIPSLSRAVSGTDLAHIMP